MLTRRAEEKEVKQATVMKIPIGISRHLPADNMDGQEKAKPHPAIKRTIYYVLPVGQRAGNEDGAKPRMN